MLPYLQVQALAARDRLASDLVFSVFASALKSYRCDTLVRPFPNYFRSEVPPRSPATKFTAPGCTAPPSTLPAEPLLSPLPSPLGAVAVPPVLSHQPTNQQTNQPHCPSPSSRSPADTWREPRGMVGDQRVMESEGYAWLKLTEPRSPIDITNHAHGHDP